MKLVKSAVSAIDCNGHAIGPSNVDDISLKVREKERRGEREREKEKERERERERERILDIYQKGRG